MKVRISDLPVGSCFLAPKGGRKKKVSDEKVATVKENGKVSYRKLKTDPEVEPTPCEIRELGVGLRRHPDFMVEIGDGNTQKRRRTQ